MLNHRLNKEVTSYLNQLNHPLINEINWLRNLIIETDSTLTENIKWNAPNYQLKGIDCMTLRIHPFSFIQIIFHRGAKRLEQPSERPIKEKYQFLVWKENDRAVVTFKSMDEMTNNSLFVKEIIIKWIEFVQSST